VTRRNGSNAAGVGGVVERRLLRLALLGLVLAWPSACKRDRGAPSAGANASPAVSRGVPAASVASAAARQKSARMKPATPANAPAPLGAAEKKQADAYLAALGRGRKLTATGKYAAAITAFDEALRARPDDPRALGERGFAELRVGDRTSARRDLARARDLAHQPGLLSQILRNLGTLEREEGHLELSADLIDKSKEFRATARTGGIKECPIEAEQKRLAGLPLPDWRAVYAAASASYEKRNGRPLAKPLTPGATEAEIRGLLGATTAGPARAWLLEVTGEDYVTVYELVLRRADGQLVLFDDLGMKAIARCRAGPVAAEIFDDGVPRVTIESHMDDYGFMCEDASGERVKPCSEAPDWKPVQSYCGWGEYSFTSTFYDAASGERMLTLVESGPDRENVGNVRMVVQPDGVQLAGNHCHGREAFATRGP
jgi:hypothetical protein